MKYTSRKILKALIHSMMMTRKAVGIISGSVMEKAWRKKPAPSSRAYS